MAETILNTVQELRTQKNMTQEELAVQVQVSRQTIISIEKGNYVPSVLLALKISKVFGQTVDSTFRIHHEK